MYAGMAAVATGMLLAACSPRKGATAPARADEDPNPSTGAQGAGGRYSWQGGASAAADQAGRAHRPFFAEHDIPASPTMAFCRRGGALSLDQPYDDYVKAAVTASAFTSMFSISGHPAMSVPLHLERRRVPIGVQFSGLGAEAFARAGRAARACRALA